MKVVERTPEESVITNHTLTPSIFMPRDHSGYYRYEGSLTTPTCDEGVIWTIFTHNLPMSIYQVSLLMSFNFKIMLYNSSNHHFPLCNVGSVRSHCTRICFHYCLILEGSFYKNNNALNTV